MAFSCCFLPWIAGERWLSLVTAEARMLSQRCAEFDVVGAIEFLIGTGADQGNRCVVHLAASESTPGVEERGTGHVIEAGKFPLAPQGHISEQLEPCCQTLFRISDLPKALLRSTLVAVEGTAEDPGNGCTQG